MGKGESLKRYLVSRTLDSHVTEGPSRLNTAASQRADQVQAAPPPPPAHISGPAKGTQPLAGEALLEEADQCAGVRDSWEGVTVPAAPHRRPLKTGRDGA